MLTFELRAAMSHREKIDEVNGIQPHLRFCFLEKNPDTYRNIEVLVNNKKMQSNQSPY